MVCDHRRDNAGPGQEGLPHHVFRRADRRDRGLVFGDPGERRGRRGGLAPHADSELRTHRTSREDRLPDGDFRGGRGLGRRGARGLAGRRPPGRDAHHRLVARHRPALQGLRGRVAARVEALCLRCLLGVLRELDAADNPGLPEQRARRELLREPERPDRILWQGKLDHQLRHRSVDLDRDTAYRGGVGCRAEPFGVARRNVLLHVGLVLPVHAVHVHRLPGGRLHLGLRAELAMQGDVVRAHVARD
mmetsp:Transcript_22227/g.66534  ORF Transcript_22227/g.66534 Transcript_22227/m.66534 type:complete len:247 (-) Transcript_22227:310-1050(-)